MAVLILITLILTLERHPALLRLTAQPPTLDPKRQQFPVLSQENLTVDGAKGLLNG
jgi:hypothetical protein